MTSRAKQGGFQDWGELRDRLIELYNETPHPTTEQEIIDAYENHPSRVEDAALSVAADVAAGTIRSGWAILYRRASAISTPPSNPTRATGIEREKTIAKAEQWIRAAGIHYDDPDELTLALFGDTSEFRNNPLRAYAQADLTGERNALRLEIRGDTQLVTRLLDLWAEERPTGIRIEREAQERADQWKNQHTQARSTAAGTDPPTASAATTATEPEPHPTELLPL